MLKHLGTLSPLFFGALVIIVGIFVSGAFQLYSYWEHFDTFMHVLGGLTAAWLAFALLQNDLKRLSGWKQLLILLSIATFIGVCWEFAEYAVGRGKDVVPWIYRWFHGGGLADTLTDLVADIAGASMFALWILRKQRS